MKKIFLLLSLVCLLLTGCGRGENVEESKGVSTVVGQSAAASPQGGKTLYVQKVKTVQFREPEEGYVEYATSHKVLGNDIYMLRIEGTQNGDASRVCVQSYNTKSLKKQQYLIEPLVQGHEDSSIFSADLTAGRELSLKMRDEGTEDAFFLVRTNLEGEILRVEDVFPEETYSWNLDVWADTKTFDLADGRTVICRYDSEQNRAVLTWYQEDTGETPLGILEDDYWVKAMMVDQDGILYYVGGDSLVRWDVEKNTQEILFRLNENGIWATVPTCGIAVNNRNHLLLCLLDQGKGTIYELTDEEIPDENEIRLCSLTGKAGISYFQRQAATFLQHGGEVPIHLELEEKEKYWDDYRNRIMAEMVMGKGPDILFVRQEDMILLQEKGLICDLSEMIPQEIQEELIPGVLELGTVNGELVGLVSEASFTTMVAASRVWDKSSWTIDDFIEQAEKKEQWEYLVNYLGDSVTGFSLVYVLFSNWADSFMLDLEQGTCDFDNEKFIRILEFCQKYGADKRDFIGHDECRQMYRKGDMMAGVYNLYGGMFHFAYDMAEYGEDCHIVGYPTENGSGTYVDSYSYGYLVVNSQTKYKEEIKKYFALLLDYDNQFVTMGCPVRMDVIRNSVQYDETEGRYYEIYSFGTNDPIDFDAHLKPDGTTYLKDFVEFVEGSRPQTYCPPEINAIIHEELSYFFGGSKSAEDTVKIIQRRVQLYLDETR